MERNEINNNELEQKLKEEVEKEMYLRWIEEAK